MKKYIIPTLMITIVALLIITILITKDNKVSSNYYDATYSKLTNNYINDKKYSTSKEIITINNNKWIYKKITTYENYEKDTISVSLNGEINDNTFKLNDKTVYVEKNRICFDEEKNDCMTNKEETNDNYIDEFKSYEHIININSIDLNKENFLFLVFTQEDCKVCNEYKNNLLDVTYDYNINFYQIDISSLTQKELKYWNNYFDISLIPSTLIIKDGVIVSKYSGLLTKEKISQILIDNGINSR